MDSACSHLLAYPYIPKRLLAQFVFRVAQITITLPQLPAARKELTMFYFHSVRELRRWALVSLHAAAFALVDFDGSIWAFEVFPDGRACPHRVIRSTGVYV